MLAVGEGATASGERWGGEPVLAGAEAGTALLNNAARCHQRFGAPAVSVDQLIEWVAEWIKMKGPLLGKPTHFEARDGRF